MEQDKKLPTDTDFKTVDHLQPFNVSPITVLSSGLKLQLTILGGGFYLLMLLQVPTAHLTFFFTFSSLLRGNTDTLLISIWVLPQSKLLQCLQDTPLEKKNCCLLGHCYTYNKHIIINVTFLDILDLLLHFCGVSLRRTAPSSSLYRKWMQTGINKPTNQHINSSNVSDFSFSSPEFVFWRLFSNSPQVSLKQTKWNYSHLPLKLFGFFVFYFK